ncbi:MAG: zinc ABC transporter substrate-binding protein [Rhodomicrobium sp.]|nr:MAG: zinc ABC transporter substrate-binding protein [Rhodomicrobium sp.]
MFSFVICAGTAFPTSIVKAESPAPTVVVTIKPLHGLVAAVMKGAGAPELLIKGRGNPHGFQLLPSQASLLNKAALIIRVGPMLETSLSNSLSTLGGKGKVLDLMSIPTLKLLDRREANVFHVEPAADDHKSGAEKHEHEDHDHGEHDHDKEGHEKQGHKKDEHSSHNHSGHNHDDYNVDAHIWLSVSNADAIVTAVAERLSKIDPERAELYRKNAAAEKVRLGKLSTEISDKLSPLTGRRFMVFHDAYQYLTRPFGMVFAGAVTIDPNVPPSAGHARDLRRMLKTGAIACVFSEPQYNTKIITSLIEGTDAKLAELDPIGAELETGADSYEKMMRQLINEISDCLKD